MVIFIHGFWRAREVMFVQMAGPLPDGAGLRPTVPQVGRPYPHVRPMGGDGVFVPAPPGSRFGVVVRAEVGLIPAG